MPVRTVHGLAEALGAVLGESGALEHLLDLTIRAAGSRLGILIEGPSGAGKELVTRAVHLASDRCAGPYVVVNCAAIPASLLESELFGHLRGSFTDAKQDRAGLFEQANGGTLFLDEIGELASELQGALLRAVDVGEIRPVGASLPRHVDVRVVAATNRNLEAEVAAGRFREDLYYRLNEFGLRVPPLAQRQKDIAPLARHFLALADRPEIETFSDEAMSALEAYHFPGNIRQLRSLVRRLALLATAPEITADLLPSYVRASALASGTPRASKRWRSEAPITPGSRDASMDVELDLSLGLKEALQRCEAKALERYLEIAERDVGRAAAAAKISTPTFYRRMAKCGLEAPSRKKAPAVRGAMLLSFFRACEVLDVQLATDLDPSGVELDRFYPMQDYLRLTELVNSSYTEPSSMKEKVGVQMMKVWYEQGPGRQLVSSGVEFLYFQTSSEGYRSMVRGGVGEVGAFSLERIDEKAGTALVRSSTPLDRDIERGVLIGGMTAPGDLVFVEARNEPEPDVFEVRFRRR